MENNKKEYWIDLCEDDLETAKILLNTKRLLHMGYFCHMIVEKALKAVVANITDKAPPKIHDLPRLASLGNIWDIITVEHKKLFTNLIPLQIEARYSKHKAKVAAELTFDLCVKLLDETEDFLCWIKKQLEA